MSASELTVQASKLKKKLEVVTKNMEEETEASEYCW
jgi:hypothetical protein